MPSDSGHYNQVPRLIKEVPDYESALDGPLIAPEDAERILRAAGNQDPAQPIDYASLLPEVGLEPLETLVAAIIYARLYADRGSLPLPAPSVVDDWSVDRPSGARKQQLNWDQIRMLDAAVYFISTIGRGRWKVKEIAHELALFLSIDEGDAKQFGSFVERIKASRVRVEARHPSLKPATRAEIRKALGNLSYNEYMAPPADLALRLTTELGKTVILSDIATAKHDMKRTQ